MMMNLTTPIDLEEELFKLVRGKRLVVVFVGNPSRGDDGAPQLLFRALRGKVLRMKLLDCGTGPQDCIEEVAKLEPHIVIFVNAIDRSLRPGAIVLEELHATNSTGSSLVSHKFPLAWVASLLEMMRPRQDLPIRIVLIGIQISSTTGRITTPVRKSAKQLLGVFMKMDLVTESFT
jgi:hydrogenase maturation protease